MVPPGKGRFSTTQHVSKTESDSSSSTSHSSSACRHASDSSYAITTEILALWLCLDSESLPGFIEKLPREPIVMLDSAVYEGTSYNQMIAKCGTEFKNNEVMKGFLVDNQIRVKDIPLELKHYEAVEVSESETENTSVIILLFILEQTTSSMM